MLKIKICPCLGRAVDSLLHEISVVRMNSLEDHLQCRLNRSIVFKDIVGFLRPVYFSTRNVPAETAGVAYALPLSQESFAALQIRIEAGILDRDCHLSRPSHQEIDVSRAECVLGPVGECQYADCPVSADQRQGTSGLQTFCKGLRSYLFSHEIRFASYYERLASFEYAAYQGPLDR